MSNCEDCEHYLVNLDGFSLDADLYNLLFQRCDIEKYNEFKEGNKTNLFMYYELLGDQLGIDCPDFKKRIKKIEKEELSKYVDFSSGSFGKKVIIDNCAECPFVEESNDMGAVFLYCTCVNKIIDDVHPFEEYSTVKISKCCVLDDYEGGFKNDLSKLWRRM